MPRGRPPALLVRALALGALLAGALVATAAPATAAPGSDRLSRDETLTADQSIRSANGQYVLVQQGDGNLVAYQGGRPIWDSGTAGRPGAWTAMQGDGNLVVHSAANQALFATATAGTAGDTLIMQDDGNLVIYGGGRAWWASRGGRVSNPAPAPAAAELPPVWVGSPMRATWPANGDSLPAAHHTPFDGDWSADLQNVAGEVRLFAAPQFPGVDVTARVDVVGPACAPRGGESPQQQLARGGHRVTVGLYTGGTRIGTVTYAHINPAVGQGAVVNRWDTVLGTVGDYASNSCWDGRHVHVELRSDKKYACYNRGWAPGQPMEPTNFIGFVGGSYASGVRQACP